MGPDDPICLCYDVSLRKVIRFIQRERPPVASLISHCLSAGTGCGWCVPFLERLHRDIMAGNELDMEGLEADCYSQLRRRWLDDEQPRRDAARFVDKTLCLIDPADPSPPTETTTR